MADYKVTWEITITASSPREAAKQALEIMRDPTSWATVFTVKAPNEPPQDVDLYEPDGQN